MSSFGMRNPNNSTNLCLVCVHCDLHMIGHLQDAFQTYFSCVWFSEFNRKTSRYGTLHGKTDTNTCPLNSLEKWF